MAHRRALFNACAEPGLACAPALVEAAQERRGAAILERRQRLDETGETRGGRWEPRAPPDVDGDGEREKRKHQLDDK